MKLKDIPKTEESGALDAAASSDLFFAIARGKDATETVRTSRGDFEVKFPRMRDIEAIGRLTALRQNGIPANCFDPYVYALMQKIATLDILVLSGPSWYENAKKESAGFSWQDMPSQAFVEEVYAKAYEFRGKVQENFERGAGDDSGMADGADAPSCD